MAASQPTGGKLKRRGGPDDDTIKKRGKHVADEMQSYKVQYRQPTQIRPVGGDREDTSAVDFPVKISAPDARDTLMEAKMKAATAPNGVSPYGQVHATDKDWEWHMKKAEQVEGLAFERFVASSFDLTNPADRANLEKVDPDYFKQRQEEIEQVRSVASTVNEDSRRLQQAELQKKLALIRLRGPRDKEDLMLIYGIETERVPLPRGPLWKPEDWSTKDIAGSFNAGIFSPRRIFPKNPSNTSKHWDPLLGTRNIDNIGLGGFQNDGYYAAGLRQIPR